MAFAERRIGEYKHAALKPCHWFWERLRTGRRNCYKSFYGVKSHLCIQCTSFLGCNLGCAFCWRNIEERMVSSSSFDDPKTIAEHLVNEQVAIVKESQRTRLDKYLENVNNIASVLIAIKRKDGVIDIEDLIKQTRLSHDKVQVALRDIKNAELSNDAWKEIAGLSSKDEALQFVEKYIASKEDIIRCHKEALAPQHVAISYSGEPMMYPMIGELVAEFRKKGMTTFIVTNGTIPQRIANLEEEPSQLYITLSAPDKPTYMRVCSSISPPFPASSNCWEKLNETLKLLSTLSCRTCIRITAVKGLNMVNPEGYRQLIREANPNFVEVKGFMDTGYAYRIARRLGEYDGGYKGADTAKLKKMARKYKPTHEDIVEFAKQISDDWKAFPYIGESKESTYVLMAVNWKDLKDTTIKAP